MAKLENKQSQAIKIAIHDGNKVLEYLDCDKNTTIITNAEIIDADTTENLAKKIKEIKLTAKVK